MRFEVGTVASRVVVTATREMPVVGAARLMREHHVGALVVVAAAVDGASPVGLLTDRDLVVEVLAQSVDPSLVRVADVMSSSIHTVGEHEALYDAIETMRRQGVRRLVVVDPAGRLAGLLSMDDAIALVAEQLSGLARAIEAGIRTERRQRPPATAGN